MIQIPETVCRVCNCDLPTLVEFSINRICVAFLLWNRTSLWSLMWIIWLGKGLNLLSYIVLELRSSLMAYLFRSYYYIFLRLNGFIVSSIRFRGKEGDQFGAMACLCWPLGIFATRRKSRRLFSSGTQWTSITFHLPINKIVL